jgi:hypothetical protein
MSIDHLPRILLALATAGTFIAAASGIGLLVLRAMLRSPWRAPGQTRWMLAFPVGTAAWMLVTATASHLWVTIGWTLMAGMVAGAFGLTMGLRHGGWKHLPWLALLASTPCALWVLAPVSAAGGYGLTNDFFTYVSISTWLQNHAFAQPAAADPYQPGLSQILLYQTYGFRMGGLYLLASIQKLSFHSAQAALPAACLVAMGLSLSGVWLLARLAWRLDGRWSALAVCSGATVCSQVSASLLGGFLPQVVGLGAIGALLAWSSWSLERRRPDLRAGLLTGLLGAWLTSCYSELLPLALAGLGLGWLMNLSREWRRQLMLAGVVTASWSLLANAEAIRAVRAIATQLGAQVGWHVDLTIWRFTSLAAGFPHILAHEMAGRTQTGLAFGLVGTGLLGLTLLAWRGRRGATVSGFMLATISLATFFAFRPDPWTQAPGNTWALYKLANWAWIAMVPAQIAGIVLLARWLPAMICQGGTLILVSWVAWFGRSGYEELIHRHIDMAALFSTTHDQVKELDGLPSAIAAKGATGLHLIRQDPQDNPWPDAVYAYAMIGSPLAANWAGTGYFGIGSIFTTPGGPPPVPGSLVVAQGRILGDGAQPFTAGLWLLPSDRPSLLAPTGPSPLEDSAGEPVQWLGSQPSTWHVVRPLKAPSEAMLYFRMDPGPDLVPGTPCSLAWNVDNGPIQRLVLSHAGSCVMPLTLSVGSNRIAVWIESPLARDPTRLDRRELGVLCRGWSFSPPHDQAEVGRPHWSADAPLGLETSPRTSATWRWLGGTQPITITITSIEDGWIQASFLAWHGPCSDGPRHLLATLDAQEQALLPGDGERLNLRFTVHQGTSMLTLRATDTLIRAAPHGDPRPLVLAIEDLKCMFEPK